MVPFDTNVIRAQSGARVQVIDEIPAKRIFTTPKGEQVLDFGQNMAGRIRVTPTGKPGDVIWLKCFEVLDSEGNVYLDNLRAARAEMKYTFAKEGTITWYPRFTYMGFQYAQSLYHALGDGRNGKYYLLQSAVKSAASQLSVGVKEQFPGCTDRLSAEG